MKNRLSLVKVLLKSMLVLAVSMIFLLIFAYVIALIFYFANGGNFGGFGTAPSDVPRWVKIVDVLLVVSAILISFMITVKFYKKQIVAK